MWWAEENFEAANFSPMSDSYNILAKAERTWFLKAFETDPMLIETENTSSILDTHLKLGAVLNHGALLKRIYSTPTEEDADSKSLSDPVDIPPEYFKVGNTAVRQTINEKIIEKCRRITDEEKAAIYTEKRKEHVYSQTGCGWDNYRRSNDICSAGLHRARDCGNRRIYGNTRFFAVDIWYATYDYRVYILT